MVRILGVAGEDDPAGCADALATEFGGLGTTLRAGRRALRRVVSDEAADLICSVHGLMLQVLREPLYKKPLLNNWGALTEYLKATMAHERIEQFRVLHLTVRNGLIRDEVMWTGTIDECAIHVREVIGRAIELGSASLIFAHNHPSGDPTPSRADIDITRSVAEIGRRLGITVHDHVIVGTEGLTSLRAQNLI